LRVLRGLKLHVEFPVYEGDTYIGRRDDEPVDIDLGDQEPADRIWSSRRHARLTFADGLLTLEDLHSMNGTFVNRHRLYPGQKRSLSAGDVIQIGTVQLKVLV
jgi:pSer/pThr/pTyr-binding forkhead associated (FHA) protein